jgi:hypothetical protein
MQLDDVIAFEVVSAGPHRIAQTTPVNGSYPQVKKPIVMAPIAMAHAPSAPREDVPGEAIELPTLPIAPLERR